jgi:predicted ferric reductase
MTRYKIIFFLILIGLLSLAPITILSTSTLAENFKYPVLAASFFQRLVGMWAFTLLFVQLILGAFMPTLTEKFGGWIYSWHIFQGVLIYGLILAHPSLFVLFNYYVGTGFDPFYVFTQLCLLCKGKNEFYLTFGRLSFWIFTVTVTAGYFRAFIPFLRRHWKKFHKLNYPTFLLIGLHSIGVGSDVGTAPFSFFHGPSLVIIAGVWLMKNWNIFKNLAKSNDAGKAKTK